MQPTSGFALGRLKRISGGFSGNPKQNAFSECPGLALLGALFVISKFEVAIGKTANKGNARFDFKIFLHSPAGGRRTLHNLRVEWAAYKNGAFSACFFVLPAQT